MRREGAVRGTGDPTWGLTTDQGDHCGHWRVWLAEPRTKVIPTVLSSPPVVLSMVQDCLPRMGPHGAYLQRNSRPRRRDLRPPEPTQLASRARDRARKCRRRKGLGLAAFRLRTGLCSVSPPRFERGTFGSGGRRRICPNRNGRKELRRRREGGVLPVVLYYLPRIVTNRVNLHPNWL